MSKYEDSFCHKKGHPSPVSSPLLQEGNKDLMARNLDQELTHRAGWSPHGSWGAKGSEQS